MKDWSNTPFNRLIGNEVSSIVRENAEITIEMSNQNSITIYLDEEIIVEKSKIKNSSLEEIIGKKITSIDVEKKQRAEVHFNDGSIINLEFDDLPYESYQIFIEGNAYYA